MTSIHPNPLPSVPASQPPHAQGTCIGGRYRVLEQLGRGGMAIVYRVSDAQSGDELALKQMRPRTSGDVRALRTQFEREFYVLAQLSHPSVIAVHDFGVEASAPYYTMELLDGGDLSALAPMAVRDVCELALQLCSSLSLLHSRKLVHRDISPRNVRCTRNGNAKLIDFGAMVPMGPCTQIVGTPPFVAPEVLHHLPLDARTDLFSLGATLYFALTGRKPFAARSFAELNDAWREPPLPASRHAAAIPAALDALLLSMLQIDPGNRPQSAFEVIQRLTAITGISQAEPEQIARAYLSTPALVGRDAELRRFRQRMRSSLQGEAGCLVFEGEAGLGRTRLLDMCVIEAKLAGATVLRVDGRAAARLPLAGAYGVAERLLEILPDLAASCAAGGGAVLFAQSDSGTRPWPESVPQLRPLVELSKDRAQTQAALSKWLGDVAQTRPLVLAVDDVERIDDASLAWIAALMHAQKDLRVLLVATLDSAADLSAQPALSMLREQGQRLQLGAISPAQTEALFASMFINAPHVALVSDRVHRVAAGNLRESLALAGYMLDRRLIRYAEGNWILPAELALSDLPGSAEDIARARIAHLPRLARDFAQTQALAFEGPWTREDYLHLAGPEREDQVDDALATLVDKSVLVANDDRYTLSHLGVRACLVADVQADELEQRHLALAELCLRSGRPVIVEVHHWLLAGRVDRALDRLVPLLQSISSVVSLYEWATVARASVAAIVERATTLAIERKRPAREVHAMKRRLVEFAQTLDEGLHLRHAPDWLAQIQRDSGFEDYQRLAPQLETKQRLAEALRLARARYESSSEHDRVYRPEEAIVFLAHYIAMDSTFAIRGNDTGRMIRMNAKFEPFIGFSSLIDANASLQTAVTEMYCAAHAERSRERMLDVYQRLGSLDGSSYPYFQTRRISAIAHLAVLEVMLGYPSAEEWIEQMAKDSLQRLRALGLRRMLCVFDGDAAGAARFSKEAEFLAIQTGGRGLVPASYLLDLCSQLHAGDLAGVKHVADRIEAHARKAPGWLPLHHVAQAAFQRMRGDLLAALEAAERALALSDPDRFLDSPQLNAWTLAAAEYVTVLTELGRAAEARRAGLRMRQQCRKLAIGALAAPLERALALCEAKLGDCARASARLDALIARRAYCRPSFLAIDYEARARVAIAARDLDAAERFTQLATRPEVAGSRAITVRRRLIDEARRAGLELDSPVSGFESAVLGSERPREVAPAVNMRLVDLERLDPSIRAQRLLDLLVTTAGARAGHLYYARQGSLVRVATFAAAPDAGLDRFAIGYFRQELERTAMTTVFTEVSGVGELGTAKWTSQNGTVHQIALLRSERDDACVGLVALCGAGQTSSAEYRTLSNAISARVLELRDVEK